MASNIKTLVDVRLTLTASGGAGTRWAATSGTDLAGLGLKGRLVTCVARLDSDAATATNAIFRLVRGSTLAAVPDDLNVVYESATVAAPAVSATAAALQDDMFEEGACYVINPDESLTFGVQETHGGAGNVVWKVRLVAEVWL